MQGRHHIGPSGGAGIAWFGEHRRRVGPVSGLSFRRQEEQEQGGSVQRGVVSI